MSTSQAPLPYGQVAAPAAQAGKWQWAAYPGQDPQWYWFPDPPPATSPTATAPMATVPVAASPVAAPPTSAGIWADFRRRARRLGFLLLVLGFICSGVVLFDSLTDRTPGQSMALEIGGGDGGPEASGADPDQVDQGAEPAQADGGADPATDPAQADGPADPATDPAQADPGAGPAQPDPGTDGSQAGQPVAQGETTVLDELANVLHDRAQAYADARVDGNVDAALEYVEPACRELVRAAMAESVDASRAAFNGVRLQVASVRVTEADGKVAYRLDGQADGVDELDVPSEDVPELWLQQDGHWYRAMPECGS